jgi:hypothetical protein
VCAPVLVHLPIRFRSLFGKAFIEMTPVITSQGHRYWFTVPDQGISLPLGDPEPIDTLLRVNPANGFVSVNDGRTGYGWVLQTSMPDSCLGGSGYVLSRPSERNGIAHCGFRLAVRDVPKGQYLITNWVFFSLEGASGLAREARMIGSRSRITVAGGGVFANRFTRVRALGRKE